MFGNHTQFHSEFWNAQHGSNASYRVPRHTDIITLPDGIICNKVGLSDDDEACHYVNREPSCTNAVSLVNYLNIMVCHLHVNSSFSGVLKLLAFTMFALFIQGMTLFLMGRYFVVPNAIMLAKRLKMFGYEFGVVMVTMLTGLPHVILLLSHCTPNRNGPLYFTDMVSKILATFTIGMFIIGSKTQYQVRPATFAVTMTLLYVGTLYLFFVIYYKVQNDALPVDKRPSFNIVIHAFLTFIFYTGYIGYVLISTYYSRHVKKRKVIVKNRWERGLQRAQMVAALTANDEEEEMTENSSEKSSQSADLDEIERAPGIEQKSSMMKSVVAVNIKEIASDEYLVQAVTDNEHVDPWEIFFDAISPFRTIKRVNTFFVFMTSPIWILLAFTTPVVRGEHNLNGWCKGLAITSVILFPFLLYTLASVQFMCALLLTGLLVGFLTLLLTDCRRVPAFHTYFGVFGILVGSFYYIIIEAELNCIMWQVINYFYLWKSDAVLLITSPLSSTITEAIFVVTLINSGFVDMAYGSVVGSALFLCYISLPLIVTQPCYPNDEVLVTANTETAFYFLITIYSIFVLGVLFSNFQIRCSLAMALGFLYCLFFLMLIMSVNGNIHPLGTQHSLQKLDRSKQKNWA